MAAGATASITSNKLSLAGVLDFESVLAVEKQGQEWLKNSTLPECHVDLRMITYSSSAGIALLLSWLRTAQQHKKILRIQHLPASMAALAQVGGLENLLNVPEEK